MSELDATQSSNWIRMVELAMEAILGDQDYSALEGKLEEISSQPSMLHMTGFDSVYIEAWEQLARQIVTADLIDEDVTSAMMEFANEYDLTQDDLNRNGLYGLLAMRLALQDLEEGILPERMSYSGDLPIILRKNEKLIWAFTGVDYMERKTYRHYEGKSQGFSVRVTKRVYYRYNQFATYPVIDTQMSYTWGKLFVTDKNLYFCSGSKSLRVGYDKMLAITPYANGFGVHRDTQTPKHHMFRTGEGWFVCNLVSALAYAYLNGPPLKTAGDVRELEKGSTPPEVGTRIQSDADQVPDEGGSGDSARRVEASRVGKYAPLRDYLANESRNSVTLSFSEIEEILVTSLPKSAYRHNAWWSNNRDHSHARQWMDTGWLTADVSLTAERVTFRRA